MMRFGIKRKRESLFFNTEISRVKQRKAEGTYLQRVKEGKRERVREGCFQSIL